MAERIEHISLDAVQGGNEEWSEVYIAIQQANTAVANAVMRQESRQSFWLCQKAGRDG